MVLRFTFFICCFVLFVNLPAQTFHSHSALADGKIYKLKIEKEGIYKIDFKQLKDLGLNPLAIDVKGVNILSGHAALLPQPNNSYRLDDLKQIPVKSVGLTDGQWNENDFLLFYAQSANSLIYDPISNFVHVEQHPYARENYCFLKIGGEERSEIREVYSLDEEAIFLENFTEIVHHEQELDNLLNSGRQWVGEEVKEGEGLSFVLTAYNKQANTSAKLYLQAVSKAKQRASFSVFINGQQIGSLATEAAQPVAFGYVAKQSTAFYEFPLPLQNQFKLKLGFNQAATYQGYLDLFTLNYPRKLILGESQLIFQSIAAATMDKVEWRVAGDITGAEVWDVTNPYQAGEIKWKERNGKIEFVTEAGELKRFVAFKYTNVLIPNDIQRIENQNLHGLTSPDLLIVHPKAFKAAAEQIASLRRSNDGLSVATVEVEQIYNEFSSGKQDITAIRDFIRMLYLRGKLKYVLLLGDASYNYHLPNGAGNTNWVPTYQSRQSLHNVYSYASDDYFGLLDAEEGDWLEDDRSSEDLDVAVGRLPAKSAEEALMMAKKLEAYEYESAFSSWRQRLLFVADDGDQNRSQLQSDYLARIVEEESPRLTPKRVFVDAYPQVKDNYGKRSPATREAINEEVKKGVLLLDYIGHGSETAWANEHILDVGMIQNWANWQKLFFMFTATCEFGRFDDPKKVTGAEYALLSDKGGAIGLITTTRPIFPNTTFLFSAEFYKNVFKEVNGQRLRIGDVFRTAKNNSIEGVTNRNLSLLADPSMKLNIPENKVEVTTINGKAPIAADTLQPLQQVLVAGEVQYGQEPFSGLIELTLWDDTTAVETLGEEGAGTKMTFYNRQEVLFRGMTKVREGKFQVEFIVPEVIKEKIRIGKISCYAFNDKGHDVGGYLSEVALGNTPVPSGSDLQPPIIRVYIDGKEFSNGDKVSSTPILLVEFEDEHGVSVKNDTLGGIVADLNGKKKLLSDYYVADSSTYKKGKLLYQFDKLEKGAYTLKLSASDIRGNRGVEVVKFLVTANNFLLREEVKVYPNPASDFVVFEMKVIGAEDSFLCSLHLFDRIGRKVYSNHIPVSTSSEGIIQLKVEDLASLNLSGLYMYKIFLKPHSSLQQIQQMGKLVVN